MQEQTETCLPLVGVGLAQQLEADRRVQTDFAYHQPGLLRRTTAWGPDGAWLVLDLWQTAEDADACSAQWGGDPVTAGFMALLDAESVRT